MNSKKLRLDTIKTVVSSREVSSQEELLEILKGEGFDLTQATLSRDLKQLKIARATTILGKYVYVLPNDVMYKRPNTDSLKKMMINTGFISIEFSGNLAVIKTRPGYANRMAYDIDNEKFSEILGTVAGDDTILLVIKQGITPHKLSKALLKVIPDIFNKE